MATISSSELQSIRNACAETQTVNYTKTQINAAAQAIEDLIVSSASSISTAINSATSPLTLSAAQKKKLVAEVLKSKYERDK